MIQKNEVYTRISTAVKALYSTAYVTGRYEAVPSRFPAVWCVEVDTYPDQRYMTLDNTDEQRVSLFEVQAFSNLTSGATTQVANIMAAVEAAFREMDYRMTTKTPVDNADPSIYREVARFRRLICENDTI